MRGGNLLAGRAGAAAAVAGLALLAVPAIRGWSEATMSRHMLLQIPLLAACGALLAGALSTRARQRIAAWNAYGISGLVATAVILSLAMVPRLLDLVLVDWRFETAKWLALLGCGAALRLSWRPAGLVVQGFFLGNVLPMTAVAGQLYQDSPLRLCNAYLLDDQAGLGRTLVAIAIVTAAAWMAQLFMRLARDGSGALPVR